MTRVNRIGMFLCRNIWRGTMIVGMERLPSCNADHCHPNASAVKFSFTWRIFNVFRLSEMNYAEKRLVIPTNRYFQLQSRREFGFM
jgi:hypothetical protein